jgi:hypothetical protein
LNGFKDALVFNVAVSKLFQLLKIIIKAGKGKMRAAEILREILVIKDVRNHLLFALSMAGIKGGYQGILCWLRRFLSSHSDPDKIAAPIAGFLSSLFLLLDQSDLRRGLLAFFMITRVIDTLLNLYFSDKST